VAGQARVASQTRTTSQARAWRTPGRVDPARPQPGRPGALRLTRRGRRVVAGFGVLVALVAVTVIWISAAGSVQASSGGPAPGSPYRGLTQIVVRPGQTLWSIAAAAEPSGNPWTVIQQIINVNALNGPTVQTGELLWVPKS
jgi:nucleoid-associated protein YgaU